MNIIYYYYHNGSSQEGPFTLEEILKKPIKSNTPIWKEGEPVWQDAIKFSEFDGMFSSKERQTPPPFSPPPIYDASVSASSYNNQHVTSMPTRGTGVNKAIKSLFFLTLIVVGVFVFIKIAFRGGNSSGAGDTSTSTYQEKKLSVLEVERANPAQFLSAEGTYNRTLFGKKVKIHGSVSNKATVANFKDITIEMTYYSDTNSEIKRERFVLYDYVPAHSTKSFEWKINPPGGTNTIGWDALNAVPY